MPRARVAQTCDWQCIPQSQRRTSRVPCARDHKVARAWGGRLAECVASGESNGWGFVSWGTR
eukprot:6032237-Lingulodinium_polyedra.AAC.1